MRGGWVGGWGQGGRLCEGQAKRSGDTTAPCKTRLQGGGAGGGGGGRAGSWQLQACPAPTSVQQGWQALRLVFSVGLNPKPSPVFGFLGGISMGAPWLAVWAGAGASGAQYNTPASRRGGRVERGWSGWVDWVGGVGEAGRGGRAREGRRAGGGIWGGGYNTGWCPCTGGGAACMQSRSSRGPAPPTPARTHPETLGHPAAP